MKYELTNEHGKTIAKAKFKYLAVQQAKQLGFTKQIGKAFVNPTDKRLIHIFKNRNA